MTGTSGFVSAVILNSCISTFILFLFCFYRRRYDWIYQPRFTPRYRNNQPPPPPLGTGWLEWFFTTLRTDDATLIKTAGLDAAMYVRFFGLAAKLFAAASVVGVGLLVPVNWTAAGGVEGFERMSMSNIEVGSHRYWLHALAAYLLTAYAFYLILQLWKQYQTDRYDYLITQHLQHKRMSLLIHNIPSAHRSDSGLLSIFSHFFPASAYSHTYMARSVKKLTVLVEEREKHLKALEHAVAVNAEKEREEEGEEIMVEEGGGKGGAKQIRPHQRPQTALTCFCCNKVDAITHHSQELERLNGLVEIQQKREKKILQSGFVSFTSIVAMNSVYKQQKTDHAFEYHSQLAPEPRDVYWPSLQFTAHQRFVRTYFIHVCLFFLVFFWAIPVTFVQSLASLKVIGENVGFLSWVTHLGPALTGIIEGILPSLVFTLFMILLPMILHFMSVQQGIESHSWLQMAVFEKFFIFQIFNNFLLTTAASSIFDKLSDMLKTPESIIKFLGQSIPVTATFFITYVLLQSLAIFPLSLLNPGRLIVGLIKKRWLVKTNRELIEVENAGDINYGIVYPMALFVFVITFTYAIISPIILPFSAFFFTLGWLVARYHALYAVQNNFESGGLFWPAVFNKLIICIFTAHIVLVGILGLKQVPAPAAFVIPLPLLTLLFRHYVTARFPDSLAVLPLAMAKKTEEKRIEQARERKRKQEEGILEAERGAMTGMHTRNSSMTSGGQLADVKKRVAEDENRQPEDEDEEKADSDEASKHGSSSNVRATTAATSSTMSLSALAAAAPSTGMEFFSGPPSVDDYRQAVLVAPAYIPVPTAVQLASGGEVQSARDLSKV